MSKLAHTQHDATKSPLRSHPTHGAEVAHYMDVARQMRAECFAQICRKLFAAVTRTPSQHAAPEAKTSVPRAA